MDIKAMIKESVSEAGSIEELVKVFDSAFGATPEPSGPGYGTMLAERARDWRSRSLEWRLANLIKHLQGTEALAGGEQARQLSLTELGSMMGAAGLEGAERVSAVDYLLMAFGSTNDYALAEVLRLLVREWQGNLSSAGVAQLAAKLNGYDDEGYRFLVNRRLQAVTAGALPAGYDAFSIERPVLAEVGLIPMVESQSVGQAFLDEHARDPLMNVELEKRKLKAWVGEISADDHALWDRHLGENTTEVAEWLYAIEDAKESGDAEAERRARLSLEAQIEYVKEWVIDQVVAGASLLTVLYHVPRQLHAPLKEAASRMDEHWEKAAVAVAGKLWDSPVTAQQAEEWVSSCKVAESLEGDLSFLDDGAQIKSLDDIKQAAACFYQLVGGNLPPVTFTFDAGNPRAYAALDSGVLNIGSNGEYSTLFHELAHFLEKDPELAAVSQAFMGKRCKGLEPKPLAEIYPNAKYREGEVAFEDGFAHHYTTKVYEDGTTEILSMGFQELGTPRKIMGLMKTDPDYAKLILGLVVRLQEKAGDIPGRD